jgi:hypothetical protein
MLLFTWDGVWNSGWAERKPGLPTAAPQHFGLPPDSAPGTLCF